MKGPGFVSTSPPKISSSFLQGAVRREGTRSPTVPPPPLPLDTHSEEERRDTKVKFILGNSCLKSYCHTHRSGERGEGWDVGKVMGKVDRK